MTSSDYVILYHKQTPKRILQQLNAAEKICIGKIEPDLLHGLERRALLLVMPNAQITSAVEACRKSSCFDVSVLPTDNGIQTEPIRVDVTKPRLDYMETEIARICNLYCRGCADCIQLAGDEPPFYDLDAFIQDLRQLKTKFWGVEKIRLLGGEPLLVKKIDAYVSHTRAIFPDVNIRIVTNGLLIPTLSADTLRILKQNGCSFDISNYPPTIRKKKEIVDTLRKAGVTYDFGPPIRYFFKNISAQPSNEPKRAFDNCMFSHCHMMNQGGILTPCSYAYCIRRFNRHFGTNYTEEDYVDLYRTDKDGWQIQEWLSNPHLFCCNCTAGWEPIRWRDGVHKDDAVEEDWIVQKNAWTDHVIPFMQRMVMPAAKSLRSFLQRNKG